MNLKNNNKKLILILLFTIITINTITATDNTTTTTTTTITKQVTNYTQLETQIKDAKTKGECNYHINLKKDNYIITNPITWDSKSEKTNLTINGQGSIIDGKNTKTFLKIAENTTITLANMTITNTCDQIYAAVQNQGNLTINNITFKNNQISGKNLGGAAIHNKANLTINNTNFTQNSAINGGAIYLIETPTTTTTLTLNNTNFYNNTALNGACIYNYDATHIIINNTNITQNTADNSIIYNRINSKQTILENTIITQNTANTTLIKNQAKLQLNNVTLKENQHKTLFSNDETLEIINSIIEENNATCLINNTKSKLNIQKSLIQKNNLNIGIENNNATIYVSENNFNQNYLKDTLINQKDGQTHITQNNFTNNKSPNLFKSNNNTYKQTQNNTYTKNNLTQNTITLNMNKKSFNYDENIPINITIKPNTIYNTTINSGVIQLKINETIINSQKVTNSTYYYELVNQNDNLNQLKIEYIDNVNFTSTIIYENITIKSPLYNLKLMTPNSYNLDDEINYNITITNNGKGIGRNISVKNIIPNTLTLKNSSSNLENNTWIISQLNPGETKILQIYATSNKACDIKIQLNTTKENYFQNNSKIIHYVSLNISTYNVTILPETYYYGDNIGQMVLIKNTGNGSGYNISVNLKLFCDDELFYNKTYLIHQIRQNNSMIVSDNNMKITRYGMIKAIINIKDSFNNQNFITKNYSIAKPYLKFNDITTEAGGIINITATLENIKTNLTGKYAFKLNQKTINGTVLIKQNKITFLNYHVSEGIQATENRLDIIYHQGNLKQIFTNTSTLHITKKSVKIYMDDFKITPGIKTNLSVKILDYENNPVKKGVVVFKINYKSLKDTNGKTIYVKVNNSIATLNYLIPQSFTNKVYTLSVVYGGNNMYIKNTTSSKLYIESQDVIATLSNNTYKRFDDYKIQISLMTNTTSMPIYGGNFVIKINGKTITNKTQIKHGSDKLYVTISSSARFVYNITICYSGNQIYKPLKYTLNFNESKSNNTNNTKKTENIKKSKEDRQSFNTTYNDLHIIGEKL